MTDHRVKAFLKWLNPVLEAIGKNRGGAKVVVRASYAGERMKKLIEGILGEATWQKLDDFEWRTKYGWRRLVITNGAAT